MKLLFDESGALLARYGDGPSPVTPFEPVAQPGQILMEVPEGVIGEAVVRLSEGELVVDETIIEAEWRNIRTIRNKRLAETDWICSITDYEVPNKAGWIVYRQALRDITQGTNPFKVVWPVETVAASNPNSVNPNVSESPSDTSQPADASTDTSENTMSTPSTSDPVAES
jgi:hypothetical protein